MFEDLSWDNLRFVLVLSRTTKVKEAAKTLGINPSTVFRRLKLLNKKVGLELFEQSSGNLCPTPFCLKLVAVAEGIERDIFDCSPDIFDLDHQLDGVIRISTKDYFASAWTESFAEFLKIYPGIQLEFTTSNESSILSKRDVDISILLTRDSPPDSLIGKKLCKVAIAFYQSVDSSKTNSNLFIGFDETMDQKTLDDMIFKQDKNADIGIRINSIPLQNQILEKGFCKGLLPCFVGDSNPKLKRVSSILHKYTFDLWLLTHADISKSAKIKAFMDFFSGVIKEDKDLLEGDRVLTQKDLIQ